MQPIVDCDALVYEVAFASMTANDGFIPPFDRVAEMFDSRLANLCALVDATEPPILYLTGKGNFRYEIAKTTPYKVREADKPFHYYNLRAYAVGRYQAIVTVGMEADDALAIEATKRPNDVVICTQDKDLKSVPTYYYSWEMYNRPSFGPKKIDAFGHIELSKDRKKIVGEGILFFYAQILMGDRTDSIPGLKGCGPVQAFNVLDGCGSTLEAFAAVREAYRAFYEDVKKADEVLLEQGKLVNMTRYFEDNKVLLWHFPDAEYQEWFDVDTSEVTRVDIVHPGRWSIPLEASSRMPEAIFESGEPEQGIPVHQD